MTEDRTVIASLPTEGRGAKQSHGSKATRERKDQAGVFPSYSVPSLSQAGDPEVEDNLGYGGRLAIF